LKVYEVYKVESCQPEAGPPWAEKFILLNAKQFLKNKNYLTG